MEQLLADEKITLPVYVKERERAEKERERAEKERERAEKERERERAEKEKTIQILSTELKDNNITSERRVYLQKILDALQFGAYT